MHVQPNDIRYMVLVAKTTITPTGVRVTPHVLFRDLPTRNDAYAKQPLNTRSKVVGYVADTRSIAPPPETAHAPSLNENRARTATQGTK